MTEVTELFDKINREYAEVQLLNTAQEKISEIEKWRKDAPGAKPEDWDWLSDICNGIVMDYKDKPREFWK